MLDQHNGGNLDVTIEETAIECVKYNKKRKFTSFAVEVFSMLALIILFYNGYTTLEQHRIGGPILATTIAIGIGAIWSFYRLGLLTQNKKKLIGTCIGFIVVLVLNHQILNQMAVTEEPSYRIGTFLFVAGVLVSVYSVFEFKWTKAIYSVCPIVWNMALLGLVSFVTFYIVEMGMGTKLNDINGEFWTINILIYAAIYGLLYVLTMRMKVSLLLGMLVCAIAGIANGFVVLFRGSPILPSDLYLIQTAMEVSGNYEFTPTTTMLIGVTVGVITAMLVCNISEYKVRWRGRGIALAVYVVALTLGLVHFNKVAQTQLYMVNLWQPVRTYQRYGTGYGFGLNVVAMKVQKPEGYSEEAVKEILGKYTSDTMLDISSEEAPNIIVIMDEAFSDLQVIDEFATNEDYMPYFHSLQENMIKGCAYPSVLGGRTANSEYEFLTGNSIGFLPAGTVPYQQYINGTTDNVTSILKTMNYSALALHPYSRNTYRREIVYPLLGFDEYLSQEAFQNPSYLRYYIDDKTDFNKVIELYEDRDKEKPFFLFNVTMQNHSGYDTGRMENTIWVTDENGKKQEQYNEASEYLSTIRHTDDALKILIEYFSKQEEPTYILFFGDHQPNLDDGFLEKLYGGKEESELSTEELQKRYMVPFFLWSNQELEEKTVEAISLNYLSAFLFREAGMPLTAYQKYLLDLYEEIPVININGFIDKEGNIYDVADMKKNNLIQQYNMVVYNSVMNNNKGVEWAYQLQKDK